MEPFLVSARKYRPQTFEDVVGQQAITHTLENAISSNRLAQALLFCGPRGVGKTTCARIVAKKINEGEGQTEDSDFSFNIFELDAASNNSVDDIRSLIDQVRIPPQVGKFKVYIIDEVHMLSQAAFNAFLKTLEEPPKHAIFILATTEKNKIIPTILSRCQIFDFRRIGISDMVDYLGHIAEQQKVEADVDALHIIAKKADGAMRDALSIFDRMVSFSGYKLDVQAVAKNLNVLDYDTFFEATDFITERNVPGLLLLLNGKLSLGFDGRDFINGLASHFRSLMVCKQPHTEGLLEESENAKARYIEQTSQIDYNHLVRYLELANECDLNYKNSRNPRLLVELGLMKMAGHGFNPEKKKGSELIPPSFYREKLAANEPSATETPTPKTSPEPPKQSNFPSYIKSNGPTEEAHTAIASQVNESNEMDSPNPTASEVKDASTQTEGLPSTIEKPKIEKASPKNVSALSLASIKAKRKHEQEQKAQGEQDKGPLPKSDFSEEKLRKHWKEFAEKVDKKGQKILSSNLLSDLPKLGDDYTITIELPNQTMKKEVEREQNGLMGFLKTKLDNHHISLRIKVNEESIKKFAFTPEEKYQKLLEKNPLLERLRKEFDLDF